MNICVYVCRNGMYAHDTHVTLTSGIREELLENAWEEMTSFSEWMTMNNLSIIPEKLKAYLECTENGDWTIQPSLGGGGHL